MMKKMHKGEIAAKRRQNGAREFVEELRRQLNLPGLSADVRDKLRQQIAQVLGDAAMP